MIRCWRLDDPRQTLVLGSHKDHLAEVIYWGPRLPDNEDLTTLYKSHILDVTGGMMDANPELSICPEEARTFPGQVGLRLRDETGALLTTNFLFVKAEESPNALSLHFKDAVAEVRYVAEFAMHPQTHMIEARARIEAEQPVHLDWLAAPVFPASQQSEEIIDFTGRWIGEFQMNHTPWSAGLRLRENRTGRTGHEHFPGAIVACSGASNTSGQAYAFHYGWSGGHRMVAEELPDGRRQIQFGHASASERAAQTRFETATLFATFSDTGLNGCATAFQRHLRDHVVTWSKPDAPRPVHYNCWEAVYFDHSLDELKDIANRAAALGAERFVLDDGWFGKRDDDTTSLADWQIDPRKYPEGLTPLIDHVQSVGMRFGIWFEPEMINEDSDTYRAHPDWVLGKADQIRGRQQLVLNMALPEVQTYLFDCISAVLRDHDVDYVKWDHNRVLPHPDAAQTRGAYALIDRLRSAFPEVEIESCASGGGRIDFGILERTQRVWLSDSNDAHERLKIQHNAALFLPNAVTGSHVGPRECHTSGRVYDIRFRAWVAAQRHMGFEMDPRELTDGEAEVLKHVTSWWKDNRDWMRHADILRLDSSDPVVIAEQQHAQNGDRFVVFAGLADTSKQALPRPLRLTNLDPNATYRVDLINREDAPGLSRGAPHLKNAPLEASGTYLMAHGINLPWSFPDRLWVLEGTRL
ncbi:alpha-galactosidase [Cognatishimia activa]|uniref:Alpha-galactosidase n=1 Tax=Cognatishimia activa TaxID=1715691 RepID=A0A0P1ILZ6_9RHOB|nr:alpha-galactosidase [Cognatishimia activa]CUI44375.1 Alpha-galactosidase [Cognatishimia activa]CUK24654.1 Alpha-galactosidase [Cognatishimia activa]